MWITNNEKERTKTCLKNDIESNITALMDVDRKIQDAAAAINRAADGTVTGIDRQMSSDCQRALQELSAVLQNLYACRNYANRLETKEWIDDEQY